MTEQQSIQAWFAGRLPDDWFTAAPEVTSDNDEILVVGPLTPPEIPADADDSAKEHAHVGRIKRFREDTRDKRMQIADEAERQFRRKVAWGASSGDVQRLFTTMSVPVMTRLRLPERQVLDTLVESGVARSRSDALAWCVRLVGKHEADWMQDLRDALVHVQKVRAEGPTTI